MSKSLLFALPFVFALPLLAVGLLPAPQGFTAELNGDVINTAWLAVDGAKKYSVDVVAIYEGDVSMDFDFGTGDRTDGFPISDPNLDIAFANLQADVDLDGQLESPISVALRVKALNPGRGAGRQDNPFSAPVPVEIVTP
jgi:hypothetical protein